MHGQSPRMTVFSETPVEKKFQSKSMLVNVEFTKIRRGPFTGEIVIAEEIYQYRYPYYLPESLNNILGLYDLWDVGTPDLNVKILKWIRRRKHFITLFKMNFKNDLYFYKF